MIYDLSAIDTNYIVIPWLNGYLRILVAEHLETRRRLAIPRALSWTVGVKAGDEAIQGAEHGRHKR